MTTVTVCSMQEAVSALQNQVNKYNEGGIESWGLRINVVLRSDNNNSNNNNNNDDDEHNNLLWWNRFLTMLPQECSKTQLERIEFRACSLDRPNDEVLERFFRDVLPNLASVNRIRLCDCQILPAYMDMFLTSLVKLRSLDFFGGNVLHPSTVAAIARLFCAKKSANKPPIEELCLAKCAIDSAGCEVILNALDGNTCLKELHLIRNGISEISLDAARAFGKCKNLRFLNITNNPLSDQSLCHLAEGLRNNQSLEELFLPYITDNRQCPLDAFAELLKTFNFTLQCVGGLDSLQGKKQLMRQNEQIRLLHRNLLEQRNNHSSSTAGATVTTTTGSYHLPQIYLWPLTLGCIGSKPSLIYHFVRQSNLDSFTHQVLLLATAGSRNSTSTLSSPKSNNNPYKKSRRN